MFAKQNGRLSQHLPGKTEVFLLTRWENRGVFSNFVPYFLLFKTLIKLNNA